MKIWQLNAPQKLERVTAQDLKLENATAKVKITKALLTAADLSVFTGTTPVKYPVVPGKFAVGQVTEATEDSYMNKGDRVYLCDVAEDEEAPDGLVRYGVSADGNFRDFVLADENRAYVLPSSVSDEAAFLIDAVALAEHIVDEANVTVGQHVLVIGGGVYGNVLCQILIYHRAVPIFADNNPERLERAKKSGIYYVFHNDDTLKENVLKVTGGKLADAAVFVASGTKADPSVVFPLVKRDSVVTFAATEKEPLSVNLQNAIAGNLTIKGITESHDFVSTAINILANKAVNYGEFTFKTENEDALPKAFETCATDEKERALLSEEFRIFKFVI